LAALRLSSAFLAFLRCFSHATRLRLFIVGILFGSSAWVNVAICLSEDVTE
jgi:hypothetical protein